MRREYGFRKAARFKQRKAQQNGISRCTPYGGVYAGRGGDALHHDGVDRHTDHNEKALEANGKQAF